jgi:hypothetical protein
MRLAKIQPIFRLGVDAPEIIKWATNQAVAYPNALRLAALF